MTAFSRFILEHENDDLASLVLSRDRWPDTDVAAAADAIVSRRKLKAKVPEWYANPEIICPLPLSAEQCSSTETARYKAALAASGHCRIADLTGGLGVDCWQFAAVADRVLYNEKNALLLEYARGNFAALGCGNMDFSCIEVAPDNIGGLLSSFLPDVVFMDPSRRGGNGRKVFRLEDCSPNVLELQDKILETGARLMLKLSPMADISMLLSQLHCVKELHVLGSAGECKELLAVCDPHFAGEAQVIPAASGARLAFTLREERSCPARFSAAGAGMLLFEPGAVLMKAGCFNLLSEWSGMCALGPDAHYYVTGQDSPGNSGIDAARGAAQDFPGNFGTWFRILEVQPFGKSSLKAFSSKYPQASVTARALPLSSEELRRRMNLSGGGAIHIFALGTASGRQLIAAEKC